jgi:hypothetical protein
MSTIITHDHSYPTGYICLDLPHDMMLAKEKNKKNENRKTKITNS